MNEDYSKLEECINYTFNELSYISEALTHSSYANEKIDKTINHNERLEFLGDSVLSIVVSDYLFMKYPDFPEGELTKIRSKIVCEATLAECARSINLGEYMYFGKGEEMTGGRDRASILADAFEALIAAIYLDGGLKSARVFILDVMDSKITDAIMGKIFVDYKTRLQEIVQSRKVKKIRYEVVDEQGPDHSKVFFTEVIVNDQIIGRGKGNSKKEAEQNAAKMGLGRLNEIKL